MTKSIDNPTEPSSKPPKPEKSWIEKLLQLSKKKVAGSFAIAGISALAYGGLDLWIKYNLPSIIESQGSKILNRPVKIGKVKSFSLTKVILDASYVPITKTEPDYVSVDEITVGFNIFPVIFRQVLPLDITLMQPKVYLEQESDGSWLDLNLSEVEEKKSLISYDINTKITEGDIQVVPYNQSLIAIKLDGQGKYNSKNKGHIEYDLKTAIEKATANIQGETLLEQGKTQTKLLIDNLTLTDITSLIPNLPINLSQGVMHANLEVNIPSWEKFSAANIEGTLILGDLRGKVADKNVKANSWLRFGGKNVKIKTLEATVEDIQAQVSGVVDLQQGYDLDIAILPLDLATLPKTLATELPVSVTGEVRGKFQLQGKIEQPMIIGNIQNTKPITIDKESLKVVSADFNADLNKFTLKKLRVIPTVGGLITAKGDITTNIQNKQEIDLTKIPLNFTFKADLPTEEIANSYYQFPDNIAVGNLNSEGAVKGTIADPQVLLQWQIPAVNTSEETIDGKGKIVLIKNNLLLQDTLLKVREGKIEIDGTSNLEDKTWNTAITADSIDLNPFLSQLQLEGINLDRSISVNNAKANLSGKLENPSIEKIQGTASINLDVDNNPVTVDSSLDRGEIVAKAKTETIVLDRYISNLPTPVTVQSSKLDFVSKIAPLLQEKPDLSTIETNLDANLLVADGIINAKGSLLKNQWQGNIQGNNLSPYLLSPHIPATLDKVKGKVQVSGDIQPLINQQKNIPIKVEKIDITTGQEYLTATGDIVLSDLQNNLDIASAALAIDTHLNFSDISLQEFIPNNQQSLTTIPTILGQGKFTGNLRGKNLLSNPTKPGNLFLTGDVTLNNFVVNNTAFDPVMAGKVNIDPHDSLGLSIKGEKDIVAVSAQPCIRDSCRFPYLPNNVNLRVNENQKNSIIATGNRRGDVFNVNFTNFPLAILNVTPVKPLGLDSPIGGIVTGNIGVNLFSLTTKGNIALEKPGVGYIEADRFTAEFDYDLERNFAEVTTAALSLKDSEYIFNGGIDLNSGNIQGKLNIPQAYIQDILTTLHWYSIDDALNLFDSPELASTRTIQSSSIETVGESILKKLQQLRKIEQQLQTTVEANNSNIPTQLDIKGNYRGEILVSGNINNPQIGFDIDAQDWTWKPQDTVTTINSSNGLVKQNSQVISIPQIQLVGDFQNNVLNLNTAKLQVEDSTLLAAGKLSPKEQNLTFDLDNLTTDTITKFVSIPLDVTGNISTEGIVTGTLSQPEVQGNIVIADTTFNQQNLLENITGNYSYQNQKLNFNTNNSESIQIAATVPYPIQAQVNDTVTTDIKLNTEAFKLIGALTQNNLTWMGGQGNADISGTANIDLNREPPLYNVRATGQANLKEAQVKTNNIEETLTATGKINLNNQVIDVETFDGIIGNKDLSVTGAFPLLYTVNNLENPLTIDIPPGDIKLQELYKGGVAGNIILTGNALEPIIGGEVVLEDAQVSIPKNNTQKQSGIISETSSDAKNQTINADYQVLAKNFLVKLDDFKLEREPLYSFDVNGELNLNGTLNNISQLRGEGTLQLATADIDWLSSNFTLVRSRDNLIVFNPNTEITNPYLDIQLRSTVEEFNQVRQLGAGENEVADNITRVNRSEKIDIRFSIDGEVKDMLPTIAEGNIEGNINNCDIYPDNVLPQGNYVYSPDNLDNLADCINNNAFENKRDRNLLDSPAINLSSTPERSEGEIVNLLGNQFLSFAEKVSTSNNDELLELGLNQFVINPIERRFLYRVEDFVLGVGKDVGLDYLRLIPYAEGIYSLNNNFSLRGIYDPKLINSQGNSTESNSTQDVVEIKLEYRLKF